MIARYVKVARAKTASSRWCQTSPDCLGLCPSVGEEISAGGELGSEGLLHPPRIWLRKKFFGLWLAQDKGPAQPFGIWMAPAAASQIVSRQAADTTIAILFCTGIPPFRFLQECSCPGSRTHLGPHLLSLDAATLLRTAP